MKTIISLFILLFGFTLASLAWGQMVIDPTQYDSTKLPLFVTPFYEVDTVKWANPPVSIYKRLARLEQQVDSLKKAIKMMVAPIKTLRGGVSNKGQVYGFDPSRITAIWGAGENDTFVMFGSEKAYLNTPVERVAKELGLKITPAPEASHE